MAEFGGTAASSNYNITPQDLQYLQAMLNHEGQNTILHDLNQGNTDSAYGQISGLVETWLNRAMSAGTGIQQQMLAPAQLTGFSAANVPNEASTLDPRINAMLGAYLQGRAGGDPAALPNVNQYLNTQLVEATPAYGTAYKNWYDASNLLGAFGDPRSGGRSSLQQEFLSNPNFGGTPDYGVSLAPGVNINPSEGDVNAYADFRNGFQAYSPFPPARPNDGSFGIQPRATGLDAFSDNVTNGLEGAGSAVGNAVGNAATGFGNVVTGFGNALNQGLGNIFGGNIPPAPGAYDFGAQSSAANPFGGGGADFGNFDGMVPPTPQAFGGFGGNVFGAQQFGLPAGFGVPQAPYAEGFGSPVVQPASLQADPNFGAPDAQGVDPNAGFNPGQFFGGGNGSFGAFGGLPQFGQATSPNGFSPFGAVYQPGQIYGNFGLPQAQGVDPGNPFGTPPQITGDFNLPQGQGVDPGNPFGAYPQFGGNFNLPQAQAANIPPMFGNAPQFGGNFNLPQIPAYGGLFGFPQTGVNTLGAGDAAQTQGPDQSVNPFGFDGANVNALGFGGQNVSPFGFYGAQASPLFGGQNAGVFGFNGAQAFPQFGGFNAQTLGPDITAPTLGPDQFATATDQAAPAPSPFGFGGLNYGFGAQPQSFGSLYGGFGGGGGFNPFGGGNLFGGFGAGFNPSAGLGAGAQSFGDIYGVQPAPAPAPAPDPYGFSGGDFGGGLGAQPQNFGGLYGMPAAPAAPAYNPFGGGNLFGGFGAGFNPGAGLGAGAQDFGSLYGVPAAPAPAPAPSPFGFGGDVSGFDPNAFSPPAPAPVADAGGSAFGAAAPDLGFGFDPQGSENAYLRQQMANNAAMQQAGQSIFASNPNAWNASFNAMSPVAPAPSSFFAPQVNYAPAVGFINAGPVTPPLPQLLMPTPAIPSFTGMMSAPGGFGGLGGFL